MSPCAITQQSHSVLIVCYIAVDSRFSGRTEFGCDIIKENDSATKFYTSLGSLALLQFLLSHLIVYYIFQCEAKPEEDFTSDGLLMVFVVT